MTDTELNIAEIVRHAHQGLDLSAERFEQMRRDARESIRRVVAAWKNSPVALPTADEYRAIVAETCPKT